MKKISIVIVCLLTVICSLQNCSQDLNLEKNTDHSLTIYCGITMVKPIRELIDIFEKENKCAMTIVPGSSEDLYQSLKLSREGDLYLPGSDTYRSLHSDEGLLADYIHVGYNRVAMIVARDNPKQISADIYNLAKKEYAVAIGNPEVCSIGQVTKKILTQAGIYDKVVDNAVRITADSRGTAKLLRDGSVDLILNWQATAYFNENREFMETLVLDESVTPKKQLLINLLTCTKNAGLARRFMIFAGSVAGQNIFQKYGFRDTIGKPEKIKNKDNNHNDY
jgi:molybdate transport system substrate-binding protein